MIAVASLIAMLLASAFGVSAIGKLRDPDRGRGALNSLRIDAPAPRAAAVAIILLEVLMALAHIHMTGRPFLIASGAALALTIALLVVVIRAYRLGSRDDCGCFGEWLPTRIGPALIIRNAVLVFLAILLVTLGILQELQGSARGLPDSLAAALAGDDASLIWLVVGAILTGLLVWATIRAIRKDTPVAGTATTKERGEGALLLPRSASIVDVFAPSLRARLVLFTSPGCHACGTALNVVRSDAAKLEQVVDAFEVSTITDGALVNTTQGTESPYPIPAVDVGGSLARALGLGPGRPQAALLSTLGEQVGPIATGSSEITELVDGLTAAAEASPHRPPMS